MDGQQEQDTWERLPEENSLWYGRFLLFRDMGPSRSLLGTVHAEEAKKRKEKQSFSPPGAWSVAAKQWNWKERAEAWDAYIQRLNEAEIQRALTEGYAAIHERVKALNKMARLIEQSYADPADEQKTIFPWLTPDKIREWRGCLDDIAKELGHRVKKQEVEHSGMLEVITGARDALLTELAELPSVSQGQEQTDSAGADPV